MSPGRSQQAAKRETDAQRPQVESDKSGSPRRRTITPPRSNRRASPSAPSAPEQGEPSGRRESIVRDGRSEAFKAVSQKARAQEAIVSTPTPTHVAPSPLPVPEPAKTPVPVQSAAPIPSPAPVPTPTATPAPQQTTPSITPKQGGESEPVANKPKFVLKPIVFNPSAATKLPDSVQQRGRDSAGLMF